VLDAEGLAAAIHLRAGLAELSRERIRTEIMKLLPAPGAVATVTVMADAGLLGLVLAVAPAVASLARVIAIEAAMALPADPVRRLGALAVHVSDDAEHLSQRLRLANVERDRLAAMADGWWRIAADRSERAMRATLYRLGAERFVDRVLFAWVRSGDAADDPTWLQAATLPMRWDPPRFPLKAGDFIQRGLMPGPELGRALAQAEADWVAADFPQGQPALDAIIAAAIGAG
jgi:tRNA nucleotidyltransferase/poly(A) polymerase